MNPKNQNPPQDLVAIDIAMDSLQVQTRQTRFTVPHDRPGHAQLLQHLRGLADPLVVCEATGGYERPLLAALRAASIPCCLVNPFRIRAFANSEGIRAKTDPLDAQVILRFAQEKHLQPTPAPDPAREQLALLLDRHRQLSGELAREKNRLHKATGLIVRSLRRLIRLLEKELAWVDQHVQKLFQQNPALAQLDRLFQSISGIGPQTSRALLAYLAELGHLGRRQVIALAGLAPYNRDSGAHTGRRRIGAGRAKLRATLYMAAQAAARHNPVIAPYVQALRNRGLPYKSAMVAAMRKLLIHAHALLKNHNSTLAK